jgi:hypothetical protein
MIHITVMDNPPGAFGIAAVTNRLEATAGR